MAKESFGTILGPKNVSLLNLDYLRSYRTFEVSNYFLEFMQSPVSYTTDYYREKCIRGGLKILVRDFELKIS